MNMNSRNVTYSTVGDYLLPNLTLNQPRKPLGKYGRLRRTYLMNHRPVLYNTMLLNGSLYPHLMEVEQTAESRMQQMMTELLKQNPAPDKEKNQMGYDFAYRYPGMNKVLQAAGRVIRSDSDRGVVMLLDDRFAAPSYRRLFPAHWAQARCIFSQEALEAQLADFWGTSPR